MLIDVSDVSTIPIEVKNKIYQSFSALSNDVVNRIKCQEANHNNDILCAIEDYYGPFRATGFYDELNTILEKYDLVCYHATKVSSKSILLKDGLKTNDWDVYCSNLKSAYMDMKLSDEEIKKAVDIVKSEYNRKYAGYDRKAQVCFFTNMSMLEGEYAAYDQFCESIGGELARWALKDKYPELYNPLKENGKSCIVKFKLPYAKIADYEKDSIAYQFVIYYAGVYFWNDKEFFSRRLAVMLIDFMKDDSVRLSKVNSIKNPDLRLILDELPSVADDVKRIYFLVIDVDETIRCERDIVENCVFGGWINKEYVELFDTINALQLFKALIPDILRREMILCG